MEQFGCQFYLRFCRWTFIQTVVVSLGLGFRRRLLLFISFSFLFLSVFLVFFLEGFGIVPPLVSFSPHFNNILRLAVEDGGSSGCQPCWDIVASP